MACDLSLGRLVPCKSVGGIKNIYFINYDPTYYTGAAFGTNDEVQTFGAAVAFNLYEYNLVGSQSFEETNEVSRDNGTSFWTSTGTVTLKNQDAATRKELKLMSYGRPIVVTEGYDGFYKIYGLENGCDVQVNTATGGGMGDLNGYTLTITAQESSPAYFIDDWAVFADGVATGTVVQGV